MLLKQKGNDQMHNSEILRLIFETPDFQAAYIGK